MENKPTDDDAEDEMPLTAEELKHLRDFIQRGVMDMVFKGEYLVLDAALAVPKMPDYVTAEEVGKISLRSILAATILNAKREEEIYGEDARDNLLALAGRLRELVRLLEREAEKLNAEEWDPEFATSFMPMEEEFPHSVDLGIDDNDGPAEGVVREPL